MSGQITIDLINKSNKPSDIFKTTDWKKEYFKYSQLIHPDVCKLPGTSDAMAKLNKYKDLMERGRELVDEAGPFKIFDNKITYNVTDKNRTLLRKSYENYNKLINSKDKSIDNFRRYLPESMVLTDDMLTINLSERIVPLTNLKLEQVHVNWIFSRLFEFVLWLRKLGYCHLGLNPTTVNIIPTTHGVVVTSFYHLTKIDSKVETISAKYKMWYPTNLFMKKIATPDIDLELVKKISIYLLGDRSAVGTILKRNKDVNQDILEFLITKHANEFTNYDNYRKILSKNFESKFYLLDL